MDERNKGLDVARFIMALLVVCIHVPYAGFVGGAIMTLTRVAVPFFFMLSGYFVKSLDKNREFLKYQLKVIIKITLGATILYMAWYTFLAIFQGTGVKEYFIKTFSREKLIVWLLFNESSVVFHLWYLFAYIYVLIIVILLSKYIKTKYLYAAVPILLVFDLVFGKYSLLLLGREFPVYYVRNYLFVGLPFFLLGNMISNSEKLKCFSKKITYKVIVLFCVCSILEYIVLEYFNINATRDHYISTIFLTMSIFFVALNYTPVKKQIIKIAEFGREYTLNIYIIQVIWINVMTSILLRVPSLRVIYKIVGPFIIFGLSMISAIIVKQFFRIIKRRLENV